MNNEKKEFEELCKKVRNDIIDQSYKSKIGHIGCCMSCVELVTYLYFHYLTKNDYFILSKGHACMTQYVVLHEKGSISTKEFNTIGLKGSSFAKHPNKDEKHGIRISTGSLGHGLGVAAGIAYGVRKQRKKSKVVVLLGDGECQEGSIWEALMFIAHYNLNVLTIIDYNQIQALGYVKDIVDLNSLVYKLDAFNFDMFIIDGHDVSEIDKFFSVTMKEFRKRPTVLIMRTIKGKGMGKFENTLESHYHVLTDETYKMCKECIK